MLLFGSRSYIRTLGMVTLVCGQCKASAAHRLSQITRKFTLFFIPIFPISKRFALTCAACGCATKLTAEQKDELLGAPVPAPVAD